MRPCPQAIFTATGSDIGQIEKATQERLKQKLANCEYLAVARQSDVCAPTGAVSTYRRIWSLRSGSRLLAIGKVSLIQTCPIWAQ